MPEKKDILEALSTIFDPDFQQDIVSLGFIKDLDMRNGDVSFKIELTTPACSLKEQFKAEALRRIRRVPGVQAVHVTMTARADQGTAADCPHATGEAKLPAVRVTSRALAALQQRDWAHGDFLRIGVVAGGCSGHIYSATVDDELFITDLVLYESGPLRIVADPDSAEFLDGLEIDYSDDLIRSGFRFSNPEAGGSCGCGASFKA